MKNEHQQTIYIPPTMVVTNIGWFRYAIDGTQKYLNCICKYTIPTYLSADTVLYSLFIDYRIQSYHGITQIIFHV